MLLFTIWHGDLFNANRKQLMVQLILINKNKYKLLRELIII